MEYPTCRICHADIEPEQADGGSGLCPMCRVNEGRGYFPGLVTPLTDADLQRGGLRPIHPIDPGIGN